MKPTTPEYARALVAKRAEDLIESIDDIMSREMSDIAQHRLCESRCECVWIINYFGGNNNE